MFFQYTRILAACRVSKQTDHYNKFLEKMKQSGIKYKIGTEDEDANEMRALKRTFQRSKCYQYRNATVLAQLLKNSKNTVAMKNLLT